MRKLIPVPMLCLVLAACATTANESTVEDVETTSTVTATSSPSSSASTTMKVTSSAPVLPPSSGDWVGYGIDHRNSQNNDYEEILMLGNVSSLQQKWRFEAPGGVTGTPAAVGGVVYFGDWDGWLRAVDVITGVSLWETRISEDRISASVLVDEGFVYGADLAGMIFAVDRGTGEEVWSVWSDDPHQGILSSPVAVDDMIIIGLTGTPEGEYRGNVVALDAGNGEEVWRVYTDTGEPGSANSVAVWSSAAVDEARKTIYIGTGNTNGRPMSDGVAALDSPYSNGILAINYETGEIAWVYRLVEEDLGQDLDVGASPNLFEIDGRAVVGVGGKSGDYAVVDRDTGELVWQIELTGGSPAGGVMQTGAVGEGVVYVTSNDGFLSDSNVFSLDVNDGSILWQRVLATPGFGAIALANGVLYVPTTGMGQEGKGILYALDAETGEELWSDQVDGEIGGGLSISDGVLFVGSGFGDPPNMAPANNGGVTAFGLP